MAHFAEIDANNIVLRVIVVYDEDTADGGGNEVDAIGEAFCTNLLGGTWKRTSYNTRQGTHKLGDTPFRGNYAGSGMIYDSVLDEFLYPEPEED